MAPSAPQWSASAARTTQNDDVDTFSVAVESAKCDDEDDLMALGMDASELQEFFGDS